MIGHIVEAIDVVKEGICNLLARSSSVPPDQFGLYGLEEGLDGGVVVTVSSAAHRYLEAQFTQSTLTEHIPIRWNHLIDKNMRQNKNLEHAI